MIVYLKNDEIDRDAWDACISSSKGAKPYAWSWYLDIMAPGWEALADDDYDSVFPVPIREKFGIKYIATPIFLQQLGAFSPDKSTESATLEFIDYMPEFYRLIDLCLAQKINYRGCSVTERANFELRLDKSYEELFVNYTSDCRRNINLASRKKVNFVQDIKPDELINLFITGTGKLVKRIKPRDYERLAELMRYCISTGKGRIIGVRDAAGRAIFGIFYIDIPGSITLLFTANSEESRERRIGYYAINELIKKNANSAKILDFAGSSIPAVASFMESFGSHNNPYYRIYRNTLPWPLKLFK